MAASFVEMRAAPCPSQDLATTNLAFVSPEDAARLGARAEAGPVVFSVQAHPGVEPGSFALNTVQRRLLRVSAGDPVDVRPWPGPALPGEVFTLELAFVTNKPGREEEIDAEVLARSLGGRFAGQVFTEGQRLVVEYIGTNFIATVQGVLCAGDPASRGAHHEGSRAEVSPGGGTSFTFATPSGSGIRVVNQKAQAQQLFKQKDFNFESLGIGGLDRQFDEIFRRAFASRVYPAHAVAKLGIHHVKGMLLHGPPGTGKTLIARQIGKMLNGKEPKVVKGPEILSKYVGASEENIRNLFADAEEEQASKGEESELHIIIFDEIDSICKQRGSARDGTGVHDTIVNQLLTKIDGVDALNNILLIGMTNRKDMLDDAMLRPGRLEVQIEIGLPDEGGQHQFLHRGVDGGPRCPHAELLGGGARGPRKERDELRAQPQRGRERPLGAAGRGEPQGGDGRLRERAAGGQAGLRGSRGLARGPADLRHVRDQRGALARDGHLPHVGPAAPAEREEPPDDVHAAGGRWRWRAVSPSSSSSLRSPWWASRSRQSARRSPR